VIGETIGSLRRQAGLTQNQLWWKTGIHYTEISRLERGRRNPRWETMKKIAKGLDVPCWEMVKRAEELERERAAAAPDD
jgi:transcriptional regulator with XRE-family HTH domain